MTNDKLDSHHFQLESTGTAKVGGKELPKRANPILLLGETYHCPKSRFLVSEPKFLLLHFIGKGSTPSPPPKHKWHHGTNITDNYSKTFIFIRKPILPFKIVLLAITTNKERPVCNQLQWKKFITLYLVNEEVLRLKVPVKYIATVTEGQAPQQLIHK